MKDNKKSDKDSHLEVVFDERFQGPFSMIHGGYVSGAMAMHLNSDTVEVTMRNPTPAGRPLVVDIGTPDRVFLYDKDTLLIEARPTELDLDMPEPITIDEARKASLRHVTEWSLPNCFGCGTARSEDDGLHLRAGPVKGRNMVAVDWLPRAATVGSDENCKVPEPIVWAAMECTVIQAMKNSDLKKPEELVILGRMTGNVQELPKVGRQYFIMGWPIGREGRRITVAGSMHDEAGDLLVTTTLTFIIFKQDGANDSSVVKDRG